jgi:ADP-dependent NAD(P)H-hydrate dehydratase / NAD(P)H-hydrate epimerase
MNRQEIISQYLVSAQQMRDIEGRIFAAGMPVAALMEKVAGLITHRIQELFPLHTYPRVGILVGPGHNGGDALVVARELYFAGYQVWIYSPFSQPNSKLKELTAQHLQYVQSLGMRCYESYESLPLADFVIDGLFGFGLERVINEPISGAISHINNNYQSIVSIDIPSGLHTDTGEVLGTCISATVTLCLGLWKLGLLQDRALEYIGQAELIDFDIPVADIEAILTPSPQIRRITKEAAKLTLPLCRPLLTHKYKEGHLLLISGSRRYAGAMILNGLSALASGVGMLSIAVPESLKSILVAKLPEALIIGCPETENGAIAQLPDDIQLDNQLNKYDAIACGSGLTVDASAIVEQLLCIGRPLLLDADALNIIAKMSAIPTLKQRQSPTILTPHSGEFTRLFPDISPSNRVKASQEAAKISGTIILLKGARTVIATPNGNTFIIPESTPALARGGSGDVLTGLLGGLMAIAMKKELALDSMVSVAAWWHAQAGIMAAEENTQLGVGAMILTEYLIKSITKLTGNLTNYMPSPPTPLPSWERGVRRL